MSKPTKPTRYYRISSRETWNNSYKGGDVYTTCWDTATRQLVELHTGGDMPYGEQKLKQLAALQAEISDPTQEIREKVALYKLDDFLPEAERFFRGVSRDEARMSVGVEVRMRAKVRFKDKRRGATVTAKEGDVGRIFWMKKGVRGTWGRTITQPGRVGVEFQNGDRIFCSTQAVELNVPHPSREQVIAWAMRRAREYAGLEGPDKAVSCESGCGRTFRRRSVVQKYCSRSCAPRRVSNG